MSNLPLTWADKKNSSLLADFIAKHGAEYCMTAEEINQMRDAVNEMAVVQQSTFLGLAEPTSIPSGTGAAYWIAVKPGTYTNHGGFVLAANEMAFFARSAVNTFSISKTSVTTIPGPAGPASTVPGPAGPAGPAGDGGALAIINELGISGPVNLLDGVTVTNGFYLNTGGVVAELASASYTGYINVSAFSKFWFNNNLSAGFIRGGSLYNASYVFIRDFSLPPSGFNEIDTTNAVYMRLNINNFSTAQAILYSNESYLNINKLYLENVVLTEAQVTQAQGDNPLQAQTFVPTNLLTTAGLNGGFYINTSGVQTAFQTAAYSNFIDVSNFSKIWLSNNLSGSFPIGGAKYDQNQEFMGSITIPELVTGFQAINTVGVSFVKINIRDYVTAFAKLYSNVDYLNIGKLSIPNLYVPLPISDENPVGTASVSGSVSARNSTTFIGGVNTFIDGILALNPKAKFAFVAHHSIDGQVGNGSLANLIKVQKQLAEYWSSNLTEHYKDLGWVKRSSIPANVLNANVVDGIHPASDIENTKRIAGLIAHNIKGLHKDWAGKKIAWIGTSIPAGSSGTTSAIADQYPLQVGAILGCTVTNYSVSGSIMRATAVDGTALGRYSYYTERATYNALVGTANEPDLWVIDMGLNDFNLDGTDFNS